MKKTLFTSIVAGLLSIAPVTAGGINFGISVGFGYPVVYTQPVCVAPPPPVVYVSPQPVVVSHPVVVSQPVPVVYYPPQPLVVVYPTHYRPVYRHFHHHHR